MEKRLFTAPDTLICTCANHYVLMPGMTCELCMGWVTDLAVADEATTSERKDIYDQGYFEALERLFEDIDFAA
jgi:hypothetical protein